jgi:hypothetical protein
MLLSPWLTLVCIPLQPSSKPWKTRDSLSASFDSDGREVLVHRLWYLPVGLLALVTSAALLLANITYSTHIPTLQLGVRLHFRL